MSEVEKCSGQTREDGQMPTLEPFEVSLGFAARVMAIACCSSKHPGYDNTVLPGAIPWHRFRVYKLNTLCKM